MTRSLHTGWRIAGLIALSMAVATIGGCNDTTSNGAGASENKQHGGVASTSPATTGASVPDGLFLTAIPENATSLSQAKAEASVGDQVIFEARIGGRTAPFTEGAAVFLVADRVLLTCAERHGEGCPTPWDYCCEQKEDLLANMGTIQIVNKDGRPIASSVEGVSGLTAMAKIIVVGTVSQSDGPTFVVNASGIYIDPA